MRTALALIALLASSGWTVSAETWAAHRQPTLASLPADQEPKTVGALSIPETLALVDRNTASQARHSSLDSSLMDRGQRALGSLCDRCGLTLRRSVSHRDRVTAPVLDSNLADSETIYSRKRGFDPAQARLD